ncbi:hypothetical protein C8R42DRAFT_445961 [Lentinula raphanica]|nr:hypothetical protein C8R42DRAFT_445961 [Lentinula raphanica]
MSSALPPFPEKISKSCEYRFSAAFPDAQNRKCFERMCQSMILDLRTICDRRLDQSHHGHPNIFSREFTGSAGRPRTVIDPTSYDGHILWCTALAYAQAQYPSDF